MHINTRLLDMRKFAALNWFSPLFQTPSGEPTRVSQTSSEESCKIHKKSTTKQTKTRLLTKKSQKPTTTITTTKNNKKPSKGAEQNKIKTKPPYETNQK